MNLNNVLMLIIVVLTILYCSKQETVEKEVIKTVVKWDTIYVTKTDTLFIVKDSIVYLPDSTKLYTSTFSDDFIKLNVRSNVDGFLLNQTFDYELKIPQMTTYKYISKKYNYVYGGIEFSNTFVTPKVTLIDKNKNMYSIGYTTNKQLTFGYSRQLFKF